MKSVQSVTLLLALGIGTSAASAAVVSWNLNNWSDSYGQGGTSQATAVSGVIPAAYWNDTYLDGDITTDLLDSTGSASTLDISRTSYNTWRYTDSHVGLDTDGSHNREILNGYLSAGPAPWNPNPTFSSVTISDINGTYSSYSIVVYVSSDAADREFTVTDGTTTYYAKTFGPAAITDASGNALLTEGTSTDASGYGTAANYFLFTGLSADSTTVTAQFRDDDEWGGIAAIQVVPEPTIAFLGGLGLLGLLRRRR